MLDLYTSRRDYFNECQYWSQNDNDEDFRNNSKLIYKTIPTGIFMAKEVNSYSDESQVIGQKFMIKKVSITLETQDNVSDLKENDIVKYDDNVYRVESVQMSPIKRQRQFMRKEYSAVYIISLRG